MSRYTASSMHRCTLPRVVYAICYGNYERIGRERNPYRDWELGGDDTGLGSTEAVCVDSEMDKTRCWTIDLHLERSRSQEYWDPSLAPMEGTVAGNYRNLEEEPGRLIGVALVKCCDRKEVTARESSSFAAEVAVSERSYQS